jgi:hypothetical protein
LPRPSSKHVASAEQQAVPQSRAAGQQSAGHVLSVSVPLQVPSPQDGHGPQSAGHEEHVSPVPQVPSPQDPPQTQWCRLVFHVPGAAPEQHSVEPAVHRA